MSSPPVLGCHSRAPFFIIAGFVSVLFLGLFVTAAANRFESFAFANESIAYRWGHPSRISMGDRPTILPQGFSILVPQQYLVRVIEHFLPPDGAKLRLTLQLFSWGTFGIFIVLFFVILAAAIRQPDLEASRLLLVFIPWVASAYATGSAGLYYCLLPDYYHLNALLACAVTLLAVPVLRPLADATQPQTTAFQIVSLGAVIGLGVANKVTWGVLCVVVFCITVLARRSSWQAALARGVLLLGTATLSAALVLLAYYEFNFAATAQGIREWIIIMKTQQGSMAMWGPEFRDMLLRHNYGALYLGEGLTVVAALALVRGRRARAAMAVCLLGFAALFWTITKRPAGTTLWDLNTLMLAVAMLAALAVPHTRARKVIAGVWILTLGALAWRNPPASSFNSVKASGAAADNRFAVFNEVNRFAGIRMQYIMLVNNEYGHGGVYEMLLKASSNFPTWDVTVGSAWLKRFAPNITFMHEYGSPITLQGDLDGNCLVWFDRPDLPKLTSTHTRLAEISRDPNWEIVTLPIYMMNLDPEPAVQVWMHAARRRGTEPFQPHVRLPRSILSP